MFKPRDVNVLAKQGEVFPNESTLRSINSLEVGYQFATFGLANSLSLI